MKKLIFTFFATVLFVAMYGQQIPRETVLVEIGTGTGCGYCPGAAMGLDDLYANGDPVAGIEYHSYNSGDPFNTPEASQRNSYYSISGFPTAWFDGSYDKYVGGNASSSLYGTYKPKVDARMQIPTSFKIEIFGDHNGDLWTITVRVTKKATYSGTNLKVRFALCESEIPYNWQNQSKIDHTERTMGAGGAAGINIDFSSGSEQEVTTTFNFNSSWVEDNCEAIAWIQDDGNKEVLHSVGVMLPDLVPPAPTFMADFEGDPTSLCGMGSVQFTNTSIGDPISYHWFFEGGYPDQSWDENPSIFYQNYGIYDVKLIISDGVNYDTTEKLDYIGVHEAPSVTFGQVPTLCNQGDDPYELSQGKPDGGVYSGDYITGDKYFHPTQSGVGNFTVTYTYTDANGCSAEEDQTITVDNCVGLLENDGKVGIEVFPNPNNGQFNINLNAVDFNDAKVTIMDALGKVVYEEKNVNIKGTYSTKVDLSSNPQGVYFVVVSGSNKTFTQKVMLTK
jgi:PKD repeat protein